MTGLIMKERIGAAKCIRAELKHYFPTTIFSVRSERDTVRISWTDGPTTKQIEEIVNKYERGHFDGMTDCYDYSNRREDIPQVQYVFTSRNMSDETRQEIIEHLNKHYGAFSEKPLDLDTWYKEFTCNGHTLVYREFYQMEIVKA